MIALFKYMEDCSMEESSNSSQSSQNAGHDIMASSTGSWNLRPAGTVVLTNQEFPVSLLSVRIVSANNISCNNTRFASGCYVTLHLPTASHKKFRTQTIKYSENPVWNEKFYFTIQTEIKNILELEVCKADPVTKDDILFTVLYDCAKIQPGDTVYEIFSLKPENEDRPYESLEVEFKLAESPDPPEKLVSNGVLVARELCILDVKVKKEDNEQLLKAKKNVVLTVQESYEGTRITTPDLDSFRFHCIKSWEPVLKVKLQVMAENDSDYPFVLPLKLLPVGLQMKVDLKVEEGGALELHLQVTGWSQNLDLRLGYELCNDERDFLHKRKRVVSNALKKLFHLSEDLCEHEVPVIAVMATGGGLRAMTAMYGHLLALQKLNLLNCISYITTASGSTWTMTDLYKNANWSQNNLEESIQVIKSQMLKSKMDIISIQRLKHYHKEIIERTEKGHSSSFTDLWALVQEAFLHEKPDNCKLSEQRQAVNQGQNPLPIYTAMNVKDKSISTTDFREWVEFSPYEVGFLKYGASIHVEDFDSEFFMGKLVKRLPESRICFLEGIWTNIYSQNLLDCLSWSSTPEEFWKHWVEDVADKGEERALDDRYTTVYKPPSFGSGKLCEIFNDILTDRPLKGKTHNFLQSLDFDKDYLQQKEFIEWRDTMLDTSPNKLTPMDQSLCLMDIGYFINNSGPPLFKPERDVDVIILLDYEMSTTFQPAERLAKYCEVQGIPFPKVNPSEEDQKNLQECYVFSDENNPKAPIVLYFPLVNSSFREFKAPGVKRTASEMSGGKVNVNRCSSPYRTIHLTYTEEDFDKLINLSTYNLLCSKDYVFQAIQHAIQKRKNI
ncbi:cytosolic phospholipase A2 beta-like [Varanus komodoensis]|uniref:cytosolic phospholipase A2 beta-like n=1 Tax=Varanus komodoensis TaxID=61221 RepID=UPI001CF769E1|nr:cytosolic phospholipase A2 beta-like [Varanus komodoensis]